MVWLVANTTVKGRLDVDIQVLRQALRLQNIISRHDFEVAGTAMYDYVVQRPDVDPTRVAIGGVSMGGYLAPRAAAFEPRYAACVAWEPL